MRAKLVATRPVSMWRVRCFYGLRDTIIRQMRVMGSLVMIVCWLMLFIGLLWVRAIINRRMSNMRTLAIVLEQTHIYEALADSNKIYLTF